MSNASEDRTDSEEVAGGPKRRIKREPCDTPTNNKDPDFSDVEAAPKRRKRPMRPYYPRATTQRDVLSSSAVHQEMKRWSMLKFSTYCVANKLDPAEDVLLKAVKRCIANRESAAESRRKRQAEMDKLREKVQKYKGLLRLSADAITALEARITELTATRTNSPSSSKPAVEPRSPDGSPEAPSKDSEPMTPENFVIKKEEEEEEEQHMSNPESPLAEDLQKYFIHAPLTLDAVCPFLAEN